MDIANFDSLVAQGRIIDPADVNPNEDYFVIGVRSAKYNTNSFKATDYPEFLIKAGDVIGINVQSVVSAATVTPTNLNDEVIITAQASALFLANPTGTAVQGQSMLIRIKDNGTARAITYGTEYRAIGVTLPTTTVINKTVYLGLVYNATDAKWDIIGVAQEA